MALDMKKMKERLTALKNRGNGSGKFWRPQDGEQVVRIVPTPDSDPFKDYWFHYNVGNNPARQRFFAPVLVRGEEDQGVRAWGFGKQVYETLLNLVCNPEYGDITDPDTGIDITLTYGKPVGASFPVTKITPRRQSSPLCPESPEKCRELLEGIPDFDVLFNDCRKSFEEVQSMLDEFLLGDSDPEESASETKKYNTSKSTETTTVDQAFAELLG